MLVTENKIKLADFGFSTQLLNGAQQQLDTFCGSPPYAAPECNKFPSNHAIFNSVSFLIFSFAMFFLLPVCLPHVRAVFSDDHYIGGPVDVWALGVLLYFMVIGNMPFRAPTVPSLRTAVLKGNFCLPTSLSLPCLRLIRKRTSIIVFSHNYCVRLKQENANFICSNFQSVF